MPFVLAFSFGAGVVTLIERQPVIERVPPIGQRPVVELKPMVSGPSVSRERDVRHTCIPLIEYYSKQENAIDAEINAIESAIRKMQDGKKQHGTAKPGALQNAESRSMQSRLKLLKELLQDLNKRKQSDAYDALYREVCLD